MTSADIVRTVLKKTKADKAGHIGTLDPGAAGVLPIFLGKATRLAEYHSGQGKYYRAEITLGINTDTLDAFGKELSRATPNVNAEDFKRALDKFMGNIEQLPPMYSAIRKNGKHLYEYARQGIDVAREKRTVNISKLELISWKDGVFPQAIFDIECSKGTYIRTLCQDIGDELGCGGHMSFLLRIKAGKFELDSAFTLEEIDQFLSEDNRNFVLAVDYGLDLTEVRIPASRLNAFKNGLSTGVSQINGDFTENEPVRVFCEGVFLGIGNCINGSLNPSKVLS